MTDPRPLRLREGQPATDIEASDGRLVATIYPDISGMSAGARAAPNSTLLLRAYAEAEAIAAEIVHAFNAHADLIAFAEKVRAVIAPCRGPHGDDYLNTGGHEAVEALADEAAALLGAVRSSDGRPGAAG